MSVETEIIEIRQKYKQALRDYAVINNDNKALLLMIFVLMEGLEYYQVGHGNEIALCLISGVTIMAWG